jgi:hypothetical protein
MELMDDNGHEFTFRAKAFYGIPLHMPRRNGLALRA